MGKKSRAKKQRKEVGLTRQAEIAEEKETGLSRVLLYIIKGSMFLSLFAPLLVSSDFYFPFVGPKSLYFMAVIEIAFFSWLLLIIINKRYRPNFKNPLSLALLGFLFILILSAVLGVSFTNSFWSKFERMTGILMWLHLTAFFFMLSSVFKKPDNWKKILAVSCLAAVIVALVALSGKGPSSRGGSTIGNSSFMGTYLLFNFFFALYLTFKSKAWYFKVFALGTALLVFLPIYIENARAATLSLIGGLALFAFCYLGFGQKRQKLKLLGRGLLIVSLLFAVVCGLLMFKSDSIVRVKFVEAATKARLVVWQSAWQGFKEKPLLGWGQENYEFVFDKHFNPCMFLSECGGEIWFDRAHNIIFDTLVTTGLLGFVFYIALFLACLFMLWRAYFKEQISFWPAGIFSACLIAYTVQNLTVFDMISSYLMFFVILGFSGSVAGKEKAILSQAENPKRQWLAGPILIVFFVSFFYFIIQPAKASNYVIQALKAEDPQSRYDFYEKTFTASAMGRYQAREFLAQNSYQSIGELIDRGLPEDQYDHQAVINELELLTTELEKTVTDAPLDFRSLLRLTQLYNIYSFFDGSKIVLAEEWGRKGIEAAPTNQQAYWVLAQNLVYQGRYDEAMEVAEQSIELEPRWLQSYQIALQVAIRGGLQEKEQEIMQKAIDINPAWQEILQNIIDKFRGL